jgi:2C-methyl-D-erythritol 2,4-cyclodiphosphate synthase
VSVARVGTGFDAHRLVEGRPLERHEEGGVQRAARRILKKERKG